MLEVAHFTSANLQYLNSGPGPKTLLAGDIEAGFFGEVTAAELFTTEELRKSFPVLTNSSATAEYPTWLKFAYKGKFLFIARDLVFGSISWNVLYWHGLIYGTDSTGPDYIGGDTKQIKVLSKERHRFLVRTISGMATDPFVYSGSSYDNTEPVLSNEWTDLIYRVSYYGVLNHHLEKWAHYDNASLALGYAGTVIQESDYTDPNNTIARAWSGRVDSWRLISKSALAGWRPVLELIPKEAPLFSLTINNLQAKAPAVPLTKSTITTPRDSSGDGLKPLYDIENHTQTLTLVSQIKVLNAKSVTPIVSPRILTTHIVPNTRIRFTPQS